MPPDAPNHFLMNLAPEERPELRTFFADNEILSETLYPMTRGRVISVNDAALPRWEELEVDGAPRQREANFTWSDQIPTGNALLDGEWWTADTDQAWVSLEDELGKTYRYRLVGPDEISPGKGYISIDSPMARSLLRKTVDDEIQVKSESGLVNYVITNIEYEETSD